KPIIGKRSLRRWRVDTDVNRFVGRKAYPRGARFGSAQDSKVIDDLPSLLFGERYPRGHPVVHVTLGDVPKELTVTGPLGLFAGQRGYVSRAFSGWTMAGRTTEVKRRLARRRWLTLVGILLRLGRSRRVVETRILCRRSSAQEKK